MKSEEIKILSGDFFSKRKAEMRKILRHFPLVYRSGGSIFKFRAIKTVTKIISTNSRKDPRGGRKIPDVQACRRARCAECFARVYLRWPRDDDGSSRAVRIEEEGCTVCNFRAMQTRASHVTHAPHAYASALLSSRPSSHPSRPPLPPGRSFANARGGTSSSSSSSSFIVVIHVTIARTTRTQNDAPVGRQGCERRARDEDGASRYFYSVTVG